MKRRVNSRPQFSQQKALPALYRIIDIAARAQHASGTCDRISRIVAETCGVDYVLIERTHKDNGMLETLGRYGITSDKNRRLYPLRESRTREAIRRRKHVVSTGRPMRQAHVLLPQRTRGTVLHIPLIANTSVIGALVMATHGTERISREVLAFGRAVAGETARMIRRMTLDESLQHSEAKYRHLAEASMEAVFVVEAGSGKIVDANQRAAKMTGASHGSLLGRSILRRTPAGEHDQWRSLLDRGWKRGRVAGIRGLHLLGRKDKPVPLEINAHRLASVSPGLVVVVARDITDEERARIKIAASEELLRLIVENQTNLFFYVHDKNGVITYVSPSVEHVTGHSVELWKDHYSKFLTPNPINKVVQENTERCLRDGVVLPPYLCEVRHANGSMVLLELSERPIFKEGRVVGIQGVALDITEKRRLEESVQNSRDHLKRILEQIPMAVAVLDTTGNLVDVNEAMLKLVGSPSKEHLVGKINVLQSPHIETVGLRRYIDAAYAGGTVDIPAFEFQPGAFDNMGFTAAERTVHAKLFPVFARNAALVNVVAMVEDITERRHLERQLVQSQKMESIGLLAGGIAHDFNNILGGILGYASYLKSVVDKGEKIYQHIDTIERSALRAADLTSKLLAFARGGKYDVRPVDLNAVVGETIRLLRGSLDRSIAIVEDLQADLPAIEGDPGQMQQVLMNLCVNARDAMPGGGTLTIETRWLKAPDRFLQREAGDELKPYVRLSVKDTGIGIDKDILTRIFEPFFTTKEKGKGTGLGLATVYGIVKNHGGYVDVHSEVGSGTAFTVYFPAVGKLVAQASVPALQPLGGSETILVIDDEDTIRQLVRDLLESKGYAVLEAGNGQEGVELYASRPGGIDLVILDMTMPVMGGHDAFLKLKELDANVNVILSTGYAEDERARKLMEQGVRAFVQKPYRIEDFAATVRRVLDEGNSR